MSGLEKLTVKELRHLCKDVVKGYSTMNKSKLIKQCRRAMNNRTPDYVYVVDIIEGPKKGMVGVFRANHKGITKAKKVATVLEKKGYKVDIDPVPIGKDYSSSY